MRLVTESVNSDFEQLNQKIQTIRDEECEHRKLLSEGITFALIKLESAQLNKKMSELTLNKQKLQAMHAEELKRELETHSISINWQRAIQMRKERKALLKQFMSNDALLVRRDNYFSHWKKLRSYNMK